MRKVCVVLMGLILSSLFIACSEDSTTVTPPAPEFGITSDSLLPVGYTCTPYTAELAASYGTEPYIWTLADGSDPLPAGLTLAEDGTISGLLEETGEYTFTVLCTDNSDTPKTDEITVTVSIEVPSNPSFAVFFDGGAQVCSANTSAFTELDCYVFVMSEGTDYFCITATEFMLIITDGDGVPLDPGQYFYINTEFPQYVSVTMGNLVNGISIAFSHGMVNPTAIHVASFSLLLAENLDELSFTFEPHPASDFLGVAGCDISHTEQSVAGRKAAINYNQ